MIIIAYEQIEDLEMLLLQAPNHTARGGESINLSQMLSQKKLTPTLDPNPIRRWYKGPKYFLQDNWKRFWVLALWIGIMAGLFTYKYIQYKNRAAYEVMGHCVSMAKGAAETLKLNMALSVCYQFAETPSLGSKTRPDWESPFHSMTTSTFTKGVSSPFL